MFDKFNIFKEHPNADDDDDVILTGILPCSCGEPGCMFIMQKHIFDRPAGDEMDWTWIEFTHDSQFYSLRTRLVKMFDVLMGRPVCSSGVMLDRQRLDVLREMVNDPRLDHGLNDVVTQPELRLIYEPDEVEDEGN